MADGTRSTTIHLSSMTAKEKEQAFWTAVVVIALLLAMFFNPGRGSHLRKIRTVVEAELDRTALGQLSNWLGGGDVATSTIDRQMKYHNYILFSTTTVDGQRLSIGAFGFVRTTLD